MSSAAPIVPNVFSRTPAAFRRRIPVVSLRSPPDQRHVRRRPPARRPARGLEPSGDRRADPRPRRLRAAARRHRSGAADRHRAARAAGARRQHPRAAVRARRGAAPGSATRSTTPTSWRPAWPARRCSTTRRSPSGPAACCRSCARCRASSRRRATTSRIRPASSSRSASRACAARCGSSTTICRAPSATSTTCTCSAISPTRSTEAAHGDRRATSSTSRRELAPRSKGSFRLGRDKFEQKLRLDEGIDARRRSAARDRDARAAAHAGGVPARGLAAERRRSARGVGARRRTIIRRPGSSFPSRSSSSPSSSTSSARSASSRSRTAQPVDGRADAATSTAGRSPACGRRGRSRRKPLRAFYYITDVEPSWPAERQDEHLRDFNYGALWSISIHEVFPGTLPALPAPAPGGVEAAQVDPVLVDGVRRRLGALLRADDDRGGLPAATITRVRLGQLAEALIRLVPLHRRHPAALRGHVGRAGRAVLPRRGVPRGGERAARGRARHVRSRRTSSIQRRQADAAEAARGLQGARGAKRIRCADSTTRCSANGTVPFWLHRALMLGRATCRRPTAIDGSGLTQD